MQKAGVLNNKPNTELNDANHNEHLGLAFGRGSSFSAYRRCPGQHCNGVPGSYVERTGRSAGRPQPTGAGIRQQGGHRDNAINLIDQAIGKVHGGITISSF